MFRFLILTLIFNNILLACSLCSIYSPQTNISINIITDKNYIKSANFKWSFSKIFSEELLKIYDVDLDGSFSKKELIPVEDSLLSYIESKNYLTFLSYSKEIEKKSKIININNHKLSFKKSILSFEYSIKLNYKLINGNKLYISMNDELGYFKILFDKKKQVFESLNKIKQNILDDSVTYDIELEDNSKNIETIEENNQNLNTLKENTIKKDNDKVEDVNITLLDSFINKIKESLLLIEKGDDKYAIVFLLFASFVYGLIHAMGPGHGKLLAFSYFSSRKHTNYQAFTISFFIAFIHILGALILVSISIFIIEGIFSSFLDDSISYITKVSAILIILLSIYILYRKLKNKSCACSSCCSSLDTSNNSTFKVNNDKNQFILKNSTNIHTNTDIKSQNLFFVLTAGLVPCPGTVILFVYAFVLKTYFAVFLASVFISLGMGVVIFMSSFLGVSLYKLSNKSSSFTNLLEILSPMIMFLLGVFLFIS